jgi:hypothetical protein
MTIGERGSLSNNPFFKKFFYINVQFGCIHNGYEPIELKSYSGIEYQYQNISRHFTVITGKYKKISEAPIKRVRKSCTLKKNASILNTKPVSDS